MEAAKAAQEQAALSENDNVEDSTDGEFDLKIEELLSSQNGCQRMLI